MKTNETSPNSVADAAVSSQYILVELQGGPLAGQTMNVPHDEWMLNLRHYGRAVKYIRLNDAPRFHYQSALVELLNGGR